MSKKSAGSDVRRLLQATDLPTQMRERVEAAVAADKLTTIEQVDVARELIAHFEDGLAAGRSPEWLLEAFGQDETAARLIASGKRSARQRAAARERVGKRGDSIVFVLLRDLRYAFRRLAHSPGFTVTAILSLTLGIGANTAIFSVVNSLLLAEPPYDRPEQLVNLYEASDDFPFSVFSYPDYVDFREGTTDVFSDVSATMIQPLAVDRGDKPETLLAEAVSGTYFSILGVQPAAGRLLSLEDDVSRGAHPVVVLGHAYWQSSFGGDRSIVGETLRLNGAAYTVVGVTPDWYTGAMRGMVPDLYVPIMMIDELDGGASNRLDSRGKHAIFPKARLRDGVSQQQAETAAAAVAAELREAYPDRWKADKRFFMVPTSDVVMFPQFDGAIAASIWLLLAVVGLVLLIACANLASFLLARAVDRRKEIAIRLALGATRGKLVGQLLTESIVLGLIGGFTGVALALYALRSLANANIPFPIPLRLDFAVDGTVLMFSFAVSIVASLLFGLVPSLQATRPAIVETLRDESAGAGGGQRATLRNVLVVSQVAVSVVLLASAGLFLRSLQHVYTLDPGFGNEPAAVLTFAALANRYDMEAAGPALLEDLRRELGTLPGIESLGMINNLHLNPVNAMFYDIVVDGVAPPPGYDAHRVDWASADPEFFEAAGVEIVAGRNFDGRDVRDGDPAIIVSQALARRFFPGEDAVGRTVRGNDDIELTIIGIAADTKVRTLGEAPRPFLYFPLSQNYQSQVTIVARTAADPRTVVTRMLETMREIAPDLIIREAKTMDDHLAVVHFPARLSATLFGVFATLALVLAAIGLYGLVSYAQAQRVREVGIRMSLGADAGSVVRMLVRSGMKLVAIGGVLGLIAAFAASRLLSGLLYGITSSDPVTFIGVIVVLGGTALFAAWIPARRASRVDPVEALRSE